MSDNGSSKVSLFLAELIIDLVLFVICAAVCVGLLVSARGMSMESTRLTQAVYIAQDAAERWRSGGEVCTEYLADGRPAAAPGDPAPQYSVIVFDRGDTAEITVYPRSVPAGTDRKPICTLTVAKGVGP